MRSRFWRRAWLSLGLVLLWAVTALGAGPVEAWHTLEEPLIQGETVYVSGTLTVINTSEEALYDLSLRLVPPMPTFQMEPQVGVAELLPHQSAELPFELALAAPPPPQDFLDRLALPWAGVAASEAGAIIEFPAVSRKGGPQ